MMGPDKNSLKDIGFICVLFLAALIISQTWGRFPLNDDWSYTRILKNWFDGGTLQISGWTAVSLIAQIWWGRLFCEVFGFSFNIVRLSTVFLSMAGLIALYGVLKQLNLSRNASVFGVLVLAFNPFYFVLTPSYMTEIPFQTCVLMALYFGARYFNKRIWTDLLLFSIFSAFSVLIRQTGVVVPLGFTIVWLVKRRSLRGPFWQSMVPLIVTILSFVGYLIWLRHHGLPDHGFGYMMNNYNSIWSGPIQLIVLVIRNHSIASLLYILLLALPWLLFAGHDYRRIVHLYFTIAVVAILTFILWWQEKLMPNMGNVLYDFGLGPILLHDVSIDRLPHHPVFGIPFRLPLTVLSVTGLVLGLQMLWRLKVRIFNSPIRLWAVLIGIMYASPFVLTMYFIDRAMIFFLPLCLIVFSDPKPSKTGWAMAISVWMVFAIFSIGGTHDYFSWNRARWQALEELMEKDGTPSTNIDGGFEFNGWLNYRKFYKQQKGKSWWWVEDDQYIITMGGRPRYELYRIYPYRRWLLPGTGNIYVLKRCDQTGSE